MRRISLLVLLLPSLASVAGPVAPVLIHGRPVQIIGRGRATSYSTNWSGYATYKTGTTFTDVKGSWVQPSAACPSRKAQYSSFWVGIDGYNSGTVEQTGTDADCNGRNNPAYYAWYEMYPNPPVNLSMTITPGDTISAEVSASGNTFTLTIKDVTTGASFTPAICTVGNANLMPWPQRCPSSAGCFRLTTLTELLEFPKFSANIKQRQTR